MGAAALICLVLLMDHAAAQVTRQENFVLAEDGRLYSNLTLDCEEGRLVLVLDVKIVFDGPPCCPDFLCLFPPSAADFQRYLAACGNNSRCKLSVQDPQRQCGGNISSPQSASVSFACSSASAVLAMNSSGSTSGRTVAARFSSPDLRSSTSSLQCRVEASDCSNLTSTVELHIRNTERQSSSFFSWNVEQLGSLGLRSREAKFVTSFTVDLHLVEDSRVHPAYVLATADINISMTCGVRGATPPATFCNQCASSPCQEEGYECVNLPGNFSCEDIDECREVPSPCNVTEDCNNTEGSFHCSCRHGYRQADYGDGCIDIDECARDPSSCDVTASCNNTEGSFHCYCDPGFVLTDNSTACVDEDECGRTPPPCDVTARCNNTEGSFHCYCDPGSLLTESGISCMESPPLTPLKSAVGLAVGVSLAALVFIVLIVIIACFCRKRATKKATDGENGQGRLSGRKSERGNIAWNDVTGGREGQEQDMRDYLHVIPETQSAAGSASTAASAEHPYELMEPGSRHYVNMVAPHLSLGPAATPGNINTAYEPLDPGSRDDMNMAAPYQTLATTSDNINRL